ncbi:23S rRNA (uracil(1939)-C(5))-methyltransferase RlmD [Ostreibacterium oceani]|uniref:23S rRNA (uracil(1939)-C(5))-methyltransferase RlmD n=1 Tax=Ostreibacterium oceani TaxID=2654998 RepID=A0A6N7ESC2_9GAMM|nr:23S rRNA (uracil(1939)-C(5))-methyltransferase RlmD [Ostreibacterium oceani]MPV85441.1 23S rRNA (uracil(1939)-C(5))-methyltransferase RlmD [Ostreibacterium oceani]
MNNKRRTRKPKLPQGEFTTTITELLTDGRGLAYANDKPVMITGALPNETVSFVYKNKRKQQLAGQVTNVTTASPDRVIPKCAAFSVCGGCSLQHLAPSKQIAFKSSQLVNHLTHQAKTLPKQLVEPLQGSPWGYRRRARVGIKQVKGKGRVLVGFRERYSPYIADMTRCEVLAPALSDLLMPISALVAQLSIPDRIPQVEMALGDNALALNFRHLDPLTQGDLQLLQSFAEAHDVLIYLQPGNETTMHGLGHDQVLQYHIDIQTAQEQQSGQYVAPLVMDFLPYHFTQVNFEMNQLMLKQALDWLAIDKNDTVLDLFCGLGNFTLPIAQRAKYVVGVEGAKPLVDWANRNKDNNQIDNVAFYQADLTQETRLMKWREGYRYNKILIDPPRSGALEIMPLIANLAPEKVLYVSCHPATLARDVEMLVNQYGYQLENAGVMDMFSHTAHVESMALLVKSPKK